MICPECQTDYEGAVCPHCGRTAPEDPPKVDLSKPQEPEPAPEPIPEPEIAPMPEKKEPLVLYVVLSGIGILILMIMAASMLIPKLVMEETGTRKDDEQVFSLPDSLREREQKSRRDRDSSKDEYSHHMYESGDRLWGVPGELGVDYYADACNVGEDIAPGVYMVVSDTFGEFRDDENDPCYGDFTYSIYSTYTRTDSRRIGGGWEQNNAYVDLKEGQSIDFAFARLWKIDSEYFNYELDPFTYSGMFLVGKDVEPGTYNVICNTSQYTGTYCVYNEIPLWDTEAVTDGYVSQGHRDEITLEEGQYLTTNLCILERTTTAGTAVLD
ncbi:MAG: hypothetical protein K5695_07410 [Oscillospiraceae bacterium]|nr:hypothetical protein [Oscillospiraceae bacterium]